MLLSEELQNELINTSIIRSAFFNYFYQIFNGIQTDEFLGVSEIYLPYFNDLQKYIENEEYNNACQLFTIYIENEKTLVNKYDFLQQLNIEYTALFLSGMGNIPASASSYISNDGLLKGEEWQKIVSIYKSRDFDIPENIKSPEDYISVEMLYMQKLSDLIGKLANDKDYNLILSTFNDQITFAEKHILTWIDMFSNAVYNKALPLNSTLYPSVAIIMKHYVKYDLELMQELLEELQNK